MPRGQNTLLTELKSLVSAIEASARAGNSVALKAHLKELVAWARQLILRVPLSSSTSTQAQTQEIEGLKRRLRASKTSFDSMISAYKAILDAFETFRGTVDLVQQTKRLEELPATLDAIRGLRNLHTLHVVLDYDLFERRIPKGVGRASAATIRDRLKQFSPSPHAPRLFLGEVGQIENPGFFLGLEEDPPSGSCFIFALGHKYVHSKIIGVVAAYDPDPTRYAPDKATDFLSHFCNILACTLITALEHAQLEELTVRDALTGVNNRTYLERHAGRILDFAARKNLPVHLLFIDLNGFKAVNDTLGHEAGDAILVEVARSIKAMIRKYDIFVRLGGDEFVILLPDTDGNMTRTFVNRLRRTLADIDVSRVCSLDTDLRISASVGAALHQPPQSLESLIKAADLHMYKNKTLSREDPAARQDAPIPKTASLPARTSHHHD
ncbi:diguanylate cyclase (GGDEF) domain-containing protein [Desulfomicrobium norvegicum]|uniref:diguanylate cyclase n=1 Tax=Desulfomicrobium norvegicum (strain DSM 1741 / NCIMB 8310) TaxID=52561 RepID=A0A8G2C0K9_DESNO|nr:sensor domain-containing diguanylate cyclase [Desulfomicrobium norvegicum]SFL35213.1 diguanylate cyclase (GGDEF) domain-containing protein [Desulfomicrobium norvegicum]